MTKKKRNEIISGNRAENMEEYDMIEIQGNGRIRLNIPKREATEEEMNQLNKIVAEVIMNISRDKED